MRILLITERFPYPLDTGGNIRTYHLMKGLSAEHDITLITTIHSDIENKYIEEVERLGVRVRGVEVPLPSKSRDAAKLFRNVCSSTPFVVYRHFEPAVKKEIARAFREQGFPKGVETRKALGRPPFDVVHFNHLDAAAYAPYLPHKVLKVLDAHNIVVEQLKSTMATEQGRFKRLFMKYDCKRTTRYEPEVCRRMNACFVCSEKDKNILNKRSNRNNIVVIPNGVDLDYFYYESRRNETSKDIVFVGTLDYEPCEKGVWFFCREVLPLLKIPLPDVRFIVVGRNPSKRLTGIARTDRNVSFTGHVPDVRPFVHNARVFVVPLLSGSGTRLKILEAMSMGVPVVSTTIGSEGLEGIGGQHMVTGDSAADLVAAILRLFHNGAEADAIRRNARVLVEEKYSWNIIRGTLLEAYRSLGPTH